MQTCYYCGKLILGKKIMGQIGNTMHIFCSDKCRSSAWSKLASKSQAASPEEETSSSASSSSAGKTEESSRREVSTVAITGAEYEYSAKTAGITIRIAKLENKSSWVTGELRLELFLSKSGPYKKGAKLTGTTLAVSSNYSPLRKYYSYTAMKTLARIKDNPKAGSYQPVLFVKELSQEGRWQIAGYVNFASPIKWNG